MRFFVFESLIIGLLGGVKVYAQIYLIRTKLTKFWWIILGNCKNKWPRQPNFRQFFERVKLFPNIHQLYSLQQVRRYHYTYFTTLFWFLDYFKRPNLCPEKGEFYEIVALAFWATSQELIEPNEICFDFRKVW